jgi:hypothetical protein
MDDLLFGQGFVIPNVLDIHLNDLKRFGTVPVDELALFSLAPGW